MQQSKQSKPGLKSTSEYLGVLADYWRNHLQEFEDDNTRKNHGLPQAAKAIEIACGYRMTVDQITKKLSNMWRRNLKRKGDYKGIFQLGPSCLDPYIQNPSNRHFAGDEDTKSCSENEEGPEHESIAGSEGLGVDRKGERRGKEREVQDVEETTTKSNASTVDSTYQTAFPFESILLSCVLGNGAGRQAMQKSQVVHNNSCAGCDELKAECVALRSKLRLQQKIESSQLYDEGPSDKDVQKNMRRIAYLIKKSFREFEHLREDYAARPTFEVMEEDFPRLYDLYKQVYNLRKNEPLSEYRLESLGIEQPNRARMLRALAGRSVLNLALASEFPEFFHDRGAIVEIYEKIVLDQFGLHARSALRQAALSSYIKEKRFGSSIIPAKAKGLARDLQGVLWPLLSRRNRKDAESMRIGSGSHNFWRSLESTQEDIFMISLTLRSELWLNRDRYEFIWPHPNDPFDPDEMEDEEIDEEVKSTSKILRVQITLFAGVAAYDPESSPAPWAGKPADSPNPKEEGATGERRVVAKALVHLISVDKVSS